MNIPDANLRAAIEARLGKEKNDPITEAEMGSFFTLSANDAEISNLSGLEYAVSLLSLSLKDNEISSLSPLSGLTQLITVYLSGNDITSISALSRMIQIRTLSLDNNRITSLSSLPNLGEAKILSFQNNRITDISPLLNDDLGFEGSLPGGGGRDVYLDGNPLSDTSINTHIPALEARSITVHFSAPTVNIPDANLRAAIEARLGKEKNDPITEAEMGSFFTLSANDAEISNLSGLEYAVSLLSLSLKDNEISSLSPLSGLTQLITVYLSGNDITSISALSRMIQIRTLSLDNNRITSLSSLPNLSSALILSFQNNRITDISPLLNDDLGFEGSLPGGGGRDVYLDGNPLSDTSINTHIPALEARSITVHFSAPTVNIPDANLRAAIEARLGKEKNDPITEAEMGSFFTLSANDAEISNLSGLEYAVSLLSLSLKDNEISSLSPLSGLTQLITVYLSGNDITSISALSRMIQIRTLSLDNNRITSLSSLPNLGEAKILSFQNNRITDISPLLNDDLGFEGSLPGGGGRDVYLDGNPLSDTSINTHIPALEARSITVHFSAPTVNIPDANLRAAIEAKLGKEKNDPITEAEIRSFRTLSANDAEISNLSGLEYATRLLILSLKDNEISSLSPLSGLQLRVVYLSGNDITSISALSRMIQIDTLYLDNNRITSLSSLPNLGRASSLSFQDNRITDISPLLNDDLGFEGSALGGRGRDVYLDGNPLSDTSINTHIPALEARSITVHFSVTDPPKTELNKISGDNQTGEPGNALAEAFIVEVKIEDEAAANVDVTFMVTSGGGSMDLETVTTDSSGLASSTLTLGPNAGTNTVDVATDTVPGETVTFTATAEDSNTAPVFSSDSTSRSIPANAPAGTNIGPPVSAPDPGDTVTYSLDSTSDQSFNITGTTGQLTTKAGVTLSVGQQYTVTVTATDSEGLTDTITVTIAVTAAARPPSTPPPSSNTAPVFSSDSISRSIPANAPAHTNIGSPVSAPDPGDTVTYSLDSTGDQSFNITGTTGQLTTQAGVTLTDGQQYTVTVTATDSGGLTDTITVTIAVTAAATTNSAPVFSSDSISRSIPANAPAHTNIGSPVSAPDPGDTVTYSLDSTGDQSFNINGTTGQLTTQAGVTLTDGDSHEVTVTATDSGGLTDTITVTIAVTAAATTNTAPVFSSDSISRSIPANAPAHTNIGPPVSAPDPGDTVTYSLDSTGDQSFNINGTTGQLTTQAGVTLTDGDSHEVTVTATDSGGLTDTITVTIAVTAAARPPSTPPPSSNNAPVFSSDSISRSIPANAPAGTNIGPPVLAPDPGDTVTYSLDSTGDQSFNINGTTGQLTTQAGVTLTDGDSHEVTVTATDSGGLTDTITVTIAVTAAARPPSTPPPSSNTAPVFSSDSTSRSIPANAPAGTNIGPPVSAPDPGDTVTYSLDSTGDQSFNINGTTGQLTTKAGVTLSVGQQYTVTVTATDSEGLTDTITVTIAVTITDLDEFLWSIPQGLSLVHVPLKVTAVDGVAKTLETINDLYHALGGETDVNLLVTRGTLGDRWLSYLGDTSRGRPGDRTLTDADDLGILVDMKNSVTVELSGDPLGMNGMSAITLREGPNLVGVPLKDSRLTRLSDLFALEGIAGNVSEVLTWDGVAKVITHAGDEDDGPLTGGQSFVLEASEMKTVAISGTGWYNSTGINAAPLIAANALRSVGTTPVLAVTGSIAVDAPGGNYRVTVKNLSTGTVNTVTVRDAGAFQLTLVDVVGGVAQIGDILEVTAESSDPSIGVQPLRHIVTAKDVQRSVIQLDALLAYEIPSQTELLHNYPNPFNPETWIPYRLASDANVTLTIYDQHGGVVRKLDVGHRGAAVYQTREKAIYWDGRNNVGERVSSGIYFYQLQADNVSFLRKMVILK